MRDAGLMEKFCPVSVKGAMELVHGLAPRGPAPVSLPQPFQPPVLRTREARYGRSKRGYLEPDATLRGRMKGGQPLVVLFEVDLTEKATKQVDKLRRYDRFLLDGWKHSQWNAGTIERQ